jgi:hypothetical protein
MNGFVAKVRYPLALLGGRLLAAPAYAAGAIDIGRQFGVQVRI